MRPNLLWLPLCLLVSAAGANAQDWRALRPGVVVEVEGDWKSQRGFVADEIDIRDARDDVDVELIAPITGLDTAGRLELLGTRVTFGPELAEAVGALRVGDWVEIDGTAAGGGPIQARRIRRLDDEPSDIEIEGTITAHEPGERHISIAGVRVALSRATDIRGVRPELVPRAIDDDDERPTLWSAADGRVRGGGRFQWQVEPEDNFDLNPTRPGNLTESTWSGDLQADARLTPSVDVFVKAGFRGTQVVTDEEGDEQSSFDWRLQQGYGVWSPQAFPDLALQIGRQDFDEPREWLYDENLDGVRLHLRAGRLRTEASVTRRWDTTASLLQDWTNWIVYSRVSVAERWETGAYVVHRRRDRDPGNRPTWLGLRSHGRLASGVRHWAELSFLRGAFDDISRDAWAVDLGLRYRLEPRTRLSVTAGWAIGSGGMDEGTHYRQTGLHDNNDKLAGVSSLRYYGELFEPELTNVSLLTAGAGLRPLRAASVDVVYHRYAQRQAFARQRATNLDRRPNGTSTDLGNEWDVIVAFEEIPWMDIEYVFAVFQPGDAFVASATSARFHKLQLQISF
jgi:hypothetical protein